MKDESERSCSSFILHTSSFPLLAPYLAVALGWCLLQNAWLTLLLYHLQILFWSRDQLRALGTGWNASLFWWTAAPCLAAGPIAYALLPVMTGGAGLDAWLMRYGLTGLAWQLMIPYFGLVHPLLEQAHWGRLRQRGWLGHAAFAGYHALVLHSLLPPPWLALCLLALFAVSIFWTFIQRRAGGGLLLPACGHVLADLGIILAAWLRTGG